MHRLTLAIVTFVLILVASCGFVLHETHRTVTFVELANAEKNIHPARAFEIAFQRAVPAGVSSLLTAGGKTIPTINRRLEEAPSRLVVQPAEPLKWGSDYELCVIRQRQYYVQRLFGARRTCISFETEQKPLPSGPVEAPILVASGRNALFGAYYGQILKAEGFNSYATKSADDLSAADLEHRAVVILASSRISPVVAATLLQWVKQGGLLIAMRPGPKLFPVLGLKDFSSGTIRKTSLLAVRDVPFTRGIAGNPLRLHGPVELLSIPASPGNEQSATRVVSLAMNFPETARVLARLADRHGKVLPYPVVTINRFGQGRAVAFAFGLAESVVLTRQGNILWIDRERDHSSPRRANDPFFPDYIDLNNIAVPQADELQRLLGNIIVATAPQPMARFWYLPDDRRAAIIMAGDDHATPDGTMRLFSSLHAESKAGCRNDLWQCLRATSYLTPKTKLTPALARHYSQLGFELGVHVDSGCKDNDYDTLTRIIHSQMDRFRTTYPLVPPQATHRIHCIVWNGWVDVPRIERRNGIRLDMNYYYWPPSWLDKRPGFMTGSGFPMPYIDENGRILDIYQAATHLVNQDGIPQNYGVSAMLDRALGNDQFFGAFGTHFDFTDGFAEKIIGAARARGVALITARQMLNWVDGRNNSFFGPALWSGTNLVFTIKLRPEASQASVMLPETFGESRLIAVTCNHKDRPIVRHEIKGIPYGFFRAVSGACTASYQLSRYHANLRSGLTR